MGADPQARGPGRAAQSRRLRQDLPGVLPGTGALAPDADLRDALELDSLDFPNVVEAFSDRTGRRIDEDDYPRLATLGDAVDFLSSPQR